MQGGQISCAQWAAAHGKSTHLAMMAAFFSRDEQLLQHLRDEYHYSSLPSRSIQSFS
jgi:hypothetical protein